MLIQDEAFMVGNTKRVPDLLTPENVKMLREKTGNGIALVKRALREQPTLEDAEQWLNSYGLCGRKTK